MYFYRLLFTLTKSPQIDTVLVTDSHQTETIPTAKNGKGKKTTTKKQKAPAVGKENEDKMRSVLVK
jgi:hypothetical protein